MYNKTDYGVADVYDARLLSELMTHYMHLKTLNLDANASQQLVNTFMDDYYVKHPRLVLVENGE